MSRSLNSSNPLIGTFEKKPTDRHGTLALLQLNIGMFLKAIQLVGRNFMDTKSLMADSTSRWFPSLLYD